jgi:hypothetical protein
VTVAVSGGSGNPTPTGSMTLAGGSCTLAATLISGSATINVPADSLVRGNDTLTVSYTPDSSSSATYVSASGSTTITVTLLAPTDGGTTLGTANLTSGTAILTASTLVVGSHFEWRRAMGSLYVALAEADHYANDGLDEMNKSLDEMTA